MTLRTQLGFYFYFCKTFFLQLDDALKGQTKIYIVKAICIVCLCIYFTQQRQLLKHIYTHIHTKYVMTLIKNPFANQPGMKNWTLPEFKEPFRVLQNYLCCQHTSKQSYYRFMYITSDLQKIKISNTFRRCWWIIQSEIFFQWLWRTEKKAAEFLSIWVIAYLFSFTQIRGNSLGEFHLVICRKKVFIYK